MHGWLAILEKAGVQTRVFLKKNWKALLQIRERIRFNEEAFHLLLAGGVGIIGGFTNLAFAMGSRVIEFLALGASGDLVHVASGLEPWQRVLAPALGGLAAGAVLFWGLRWAGPRSSVNLLEVVVAGDGRLRLRPAIIKSISSLLSIGTGASIGREGSITQLSATLASKAGQLAGWQPYRLRLLVACGAASGIASAYNAPVAGSVFAAQIVLGNFSMNLFAPLVFASVVATMVARTFFGITPSYTVPAFDFTHASHLPWFLFLGILAGMLGAAFLKMLNRSERFFNRFAMPFYARLALGGLLVGLLSLEFPEIWGNGYSVTNRILSEEMSLWFLAGLFLAKLLATLITVGCGTVGGVLTPTLFLGASLGSFCGSVLQQLHWTHVPSGVFALVGMGSVLAATTQSPLLSLILVFEISLNYSIMPALMLACVVATLVARQLNPTSIYTEPLQAKGVALDRESTEIGAATQQTVGDLMLEPVKPLAEHASFREIADRFLTSPNNFLPVIDRQNRFIGMVALHDMKEYLTSDLQLSGVIAHDLMRPPPPALTPNQRLLDVLPILLTSEQRNIPVVNTLSERRLVGALERSEALGVLSEAISARTQAKA